ncbi:MAG: iron ABC transporter permease [Lachnospiraceae bacterium]|nr:iron ABC transporter permease [Lachnospiraceae bacterium]
MQKRNRDSSHFLLILFLIGLLILTVICSMIAGRFSISVSEIRQILQGEGRDPYSALYNARTVLFESRIPRIAASAVIGASLSCAGAAYQGIFHNPVVSPDILGAGTGAAFGAVLAIYFGAGTAVIQLSAFLFGLLAVGAAYLLGSAIAGKTGISTITLVLTGMVTGSLFSAFISIIKFIGDPYDTLPTITFWLMGGLTYVTGHDVLMMLIPFAAGMIPLFFFRWRLNVLSLDEEEAKAMGVNTSMLRVLFILCATLISSSSVAVGGMIGWVGLIVPHISRMITGPDYTKLIPCSLLIGAEFLMIVDDLSRCLSAAELPLGVLTSVVGAPFFLWLMYRGRRSFL